MTADVSQAIEIFHALFQPGDIVTFRPMEAYIDEGGKKVSTVDYGNCAWVRLGLPIPSVTPTTPVTWTWHDDGLAATITRQLDASERKQTNVYFGVCPRIGTNGEFDQAWQIRTVTSLYVDVDDGTPTEAVERCRKAGLPAPSIVVGTGRGTHVYWPLSERYLIDDAGEPPRVYKEFIDQGEGKKKKCRLYIWDDPERREKLYLDVPRNVPELSDNARHIQDILKGIAHSIGGDPAATDLARILRLPGSLNRKNQKNGKEPIPCTLVTCEPNRRFNIREFAEFAKQSPDAARREKISRVSLPSPKKLAGKRLDKFQELVLASSVAEIGQRSETDWSLLCWCVEHGIGRDQVWSAVHDVGKFAGDERYFARTWERAENHTREKILDRVANPAKQSSSAAAADTDGDEHGEPSDHTRADKGQGLIHGLASVICENNYFAQDAGGRLYHYDGGIYKPRGEEVVRRLVKKLCVAFKCAEEWSPSFANDIAEYIRVDSRKLWERPPLEVINLRNGLLRIEDRTLLPHSPDHLSTVQLPVRYDPAAKCPNIDKFVGEVFPADATDLAYEIPAHLMRPDTAIQKAVLLLGPGGNGKSVYLGMVQAFVGRANTSSLSLHKLEADKFAAARLMGKLANICPDLPSEHLEGTSVFKSITGGDTITGEHKFKDSFDFVPFARLVFSANNPPRSQDSSQGFFDRWLVIPFGRSFRDTREEIPREVLDARLSSPAEQSGLLNRALDALARLKRQRGFSRPESVKDAWQEFHATTDPLAVWLDKYTIEDPSVVPIPKKTLRLAFSAFLERQGRPPISEKAFGIAFAKLRPSIKDSQRKVGGILQWCYIGIGLSSPQTAETAQTTENETRHSQHSQDSQDSPLINPTRAKKTQGNENIIPGKNIEGKCCESCERCECQPVERPTCDGWIRTECEKCGALLKPDRPPQETRA